MRAHWGGWIKKRWARTRRYGDLRRHEPFESFESLERRLLLASNIETLFGPGVVEPVNGVAIAFASSDRTHGQEIFTTFGATNDTYLVKDIRPGPMGSNPQNLTTAGSHIFFTADDGLHGRELWVSSGTSASTFEVKEIRSGAVGSDPKILLAVGGVVLFTADDGGSGRELWISNGTPAGTYRLKDIYPGTQTSGPADLIFAGGLTIGGRVFFTADDGVHGRELWATDGTVAGTTMLGEIRAGKADPQIRDMTDGNTELFFTADDGIHGRELWVSDGSVPGTHMVTDIRGGKSGSDPQQLIFTGTQLIFTADDGVHGREPWRGDAFGANLLMDMRPGPLGSSTADFTLSDSNVYFVADDGVQGRELAATDGFSTAFIGDIRPGPQSSNPSHMTAFDGSLLFSADDGVHGVEPWFADLNGPPPTLVDDINPGPASSNPDGFVVDPALPAAYFAATDATHGRELWKADGNPIGAELVKDINPGPASSNPTSLLPGSPTIYFLAQSGKTTAPWQTDGSDGGTVPQLSMDFMRTRANSLTASRFLFFMDTATDNGFLVLRTPSLMPLPQFNLLPNLSVDQLFNVLLTRDRNVLVFHSPLPATVTPPAPMTPSIVPPDTGPGYFFIDTDFQIKPRPMFVLP